MSAIVSAGSKEGCTSILQSLESAMLEANQLPLTREREVLHVTNPKYNENETRLKKRLTSLINDVASRYSVTSRSTDSDSASSDSTASLTPRDHLHSKSFETTEEALECFNAALDAARGIRDAIVQPSGALGPNLASLKIGLGYLGKRQGGFLTMEKPQMHFPDYPIDNSDNPFVPPYSSTSNRDTVDETDASAQNVDRYLQELFKKNSDREIQGRHPYEDEIAAAAAEMTAKSFKEEDVTVFGTLEDTPCTMVTTEEELFNVAERLKRVSEIAIDLENHSMRSFQGFTCLLQLSTRREDFVIDTLKLRGSINRALAPIFTDDTIVKVLHGADQDVQWLERDFGIYVVSMFDTGQAARLLKLPSAALSFLLAKYCGVTGSIAIKKKFQLADWRRRPLPKDMFEYARSDTHYLLYIYDRMRCELSKEKLLSEAWERSAKVSRKRHSKTRYDPHLAERLAARHGLGFDRHQVRLLEVLCKWRDKTAREEDESLVYVTPLHTLFGIVRARDSARTVPGLMSHGFPMRQVPPLVHKHAEEITRFVSDALDAKLEEVGVEGMTKGDKPKTKSSVHATSGSGEEAKEELAMRQVKSTASLGGEKDRKELKAASVSMKRSGEHTVLPEAKLQRMSKCAFFDSDSESDSGSENETPAAPHPNAMNTATVSKHGKEPKNEKIPLGETIDEELGEGEAQDVESEGIVDEMAPMLGASKSVFDLSDSDDDSAGEREGSKGRGHGDQGRIKATRIAQELNTELAEKVEKLKSEDFETELDSRKREQEELLRSEQAMEEERNRVEEGGEVSEEVVSILKAAHEKNTDVHNRRKKKKTRKEVMDEERLEPFDYSNAMKEMNRRKQGRRGRKNFDPMERLKDSRDRTGQSVARRRRRGRGKSMSFGR